MKRVVIIGSDVFRNTQGIQRIVKAKLYRQVFGLSSLVFARHEIVGAMMLLQGVWRGAGVFNVEQLDPDRFMDELNRCGLPWQVVDFAGTLPD